MDNESKVEILHEFRKLLKSQAWARLDKAAQEQERMREVRILALDVNEQGDVFEMIRLKGERNALKLFRMLPETIMNELEEEVKEDGSGTEV